MRVYSAKRTKKKKDSRSKEHILTKATKNKIKIQIQIQSF